MKVLVVSKKTNLELHGETIRKRVKAGLIDPTYFRLLETTHDEHYKTLNTLYTLLTQHKVEHATIARGVYWPDLKSISAVITVGGDGTLLEASHHLLDDRITLIGVRSALSSVGKLCHSTPDHLPRFVKELAEGKVKTMLVTRLRARISSTESGTSVVTEPILNDFLYTNVFPAATTRYKLEYAKVKEEHRSSGMWVSTPCGSTAGIHAAGAKSIPLSSRKFQFLVRELYDPPRSSKPHMSSEFEPETDHLRIENLSEKAVLACDGLHGTVPLTFGDEIAFERASDLKLAVPAFV